MNNALLFLVVAGAILAAIGITWLASRLPSRNEPELPATVEPMPLAAATQQQPSIAVPGGHFDSRVAAVLGEVTPAGTLIIIVGGAVAVIGLFAGLAANPGDSAPRQTVAALWVIGGLVGLEIAAIGIATVAITRVLARGFAQR